jgi:hypothetical protein
MAFLRPLPSGDAVIRLYASSPGFARHRLDEVADLGLSLAVAPDLIIQAKAPYEVAPPWPPVERHDEFG